MKVDERNAMIGAFLATECLPLLESKGKDYAELDIQPDANANFKLAAKEMGITTLQAWGVFFGKHMGAIRSFIRKGGNDDGSEPIGGRIADAVNYLLILATLLEEQWQDEVNKYPEETQGQGGESSAPPAPPAPFAPGTVSAPMPELMYADGLLVDPDTTTAP